MCVTAALLRSANMPVRQSSSPTRGAEPYAPATLTVRWGASSFVNPTMASDPQSSHSIYVTGTCYRHPNDQPRPSAHVTVIVYRNEGGTIE